MLIHHLDKHPISCELKSFGEQAAGAETSVFCQASLSLSLCATAPSAPSFIHFSELTTTSVNVSWGEPAFPNGIIEGYRLVYEPCTPVGGKHVCVCVCVCMTTCSNCGLFVQSPQWPVQNVLTRRPPRESVRR